MRGIQGITHATMIASAIAAQAIAIARYVWRSFICVASR